MLVQEEGRLKKMRDHSVHLTFHEGASGSKAKPGKKNKKDKTSLKVQGGKIHKEKTCFFCKKAGHFKKDVRKERNGSKRKVTTMFQ